MARKVVKNGIIKYFCEKCGSRMFSVLKGANDLVDRDNPLSFKKFFDDSSPEGPFYICQFCKTIHKGYYIDQSYKIDFRPINPGNLK